MIVVVRPSEGDMAQSQLPKAPIQHSTNRSSEAILPSLQPRHVHCSSTWCLKPLNLSKRDLLSEYLNRVYRRHGAIIIYSRVLLVGVACAVPSNWAFCCWDDNPRKKQKIVPWGEVCFLVRSNCVKLQPYCSFLLRKNHFMKQAFYEYVPSWHTVVIGYCRKLTGKNLHSFSHARFVL